MIETPRSPIVAVLGASGLIGEAICVYLLSHGHTVIPVARGFTPVQNAAWKDGPFGFLLLMRRSPLCKRRSQHYKPTLSSTVLARSKMRRVRQPRAQIEHS